MSLWDTCSGETLLPDFFEDMVGKFLLLVRLIEKYPNPCDIPIMERKNCP